VSVGALVALRPLARRLDRSGAVEGIGSRRLIGRTGVILDGIPGGPHEMGLVRVDREEWRAGSVDGAPIAEGVTIRVVDVQGTCLVVSKAPTAAFETEDREEST
jgi:membrane protein implicated in regulation of membrane protease activity